MDSPLVSVIVVNYNGKDHLQVLLDSVKAQAFPSEQVEVWIVDNGSSDGSVSYVQDHHPHVQIIVNSENLGFARPNNQAAERARGRYLAFVNNDMKLEPDWLSTMVAALDSAPPDVACIGSRILNWDGSHVDFIGGTMAFNGMGFQPGYQAPTHSPEGQAFPDELLFACGGAMLIRRDVYLDIGGFDEDYFAYYEDVDLGWRLWVLGYRVLFCPEAVVYHRHNGTSGRFDWRKKIVLFERNALFSVIKNYEASTLERVWPAALLLTFKRLAVRSGIDRSDFRFGPAQLQPRLEQAQEARSATRLDKVFKNLARVGVKPTIKKVVLALARMVLDRWGGVHEEFGASVPIMREAYASVVGMEDVIDSLPRMMEKRRHIQARRRRSDAEVAARFGEPLRSVEGRGDYMESHWTVARELGLLEVFAETAGKTSIR